MHPEAANLPSGEALVDAIDACLPQTQCEQCGHPGCRPYAEAIARGEGINRCPPGGEQTIRDLAGLLERPVQPPHDPEAFARPPRVALIREDECIGCTKCIQACPVDAILGAAKRMHTVIESECTGCDLCVEPCPVDCIDMVAIREPAQTPEARRERAAHFRYRFQFRRQRQAREREEREARRQERLEAAKAKAAKESAEAKRKARAEAVKAAVERKRAQQAAKSNQRIPAEALNQNLRQAAPKKSAPRPKTSNPKNGGHY